MSYVPTMLRLGALLFVCTLHCHKSPVCSCLVANTTESAQNLYTVVEMQPPA